MPPDRQFLLHEFTNTKIPFTNTAQYSKNYIFKAIVQFALLLLFKILILVIFLYQAFLQRCCTLCSPRLSHESLKRIFHIFIFIEDNASNQSIQSKTRLHNVNKWMLKVIWNILINMLICVNFLYVEKSHKPQCNNVIFGNRQCRDNSRINWQYFRQITRSSDFCSTGRFCQGVRCKNQFPGQKTVFNIGSHRCLLYS